MRARFVVPAVLSVVITSAVAGDNDPPSPPAPVVAMANKATPTVWAPATKREPRPEIAAILYYSSKADLGKLATPNSRQRLLHSLEGIRQAKKSPEEGGLGVIGGTRDVEESWADFVRHLTPSPDPRVFSSDEDLRAQAEIDAETMRPYLRAGGTVLVLEQANKKWFYGFTPVSSATSVCAQIAFMIDEHDRTHPQVAAEDRKLRASRSAPSAPTISPVSSTAQAKVIKTASATDSGGQR